MTRLSGPRVVLVPCPHSVATAVAGSGDVAAALAGVGLTAAPGWPHADSPDALRPHAEHGDPATDADVWLVVDDGAVVGDAGLAGPVDGAGEQEIGYGLAPGARGQGLGTEAVAVLCAFLESRPGVRRVVAEVEVGNEASGRLLARLGFRPTPATPPYQRWVRGPEQGRPVGRLLPGPVPGRHVC